MRSRFHIAGSPSPSESMTRAEFFAARCCTWGHGTLRTCSTCRRYVPLFEEAIAEIRGKCAREAEKKALAVGPEAAAQEIARAVRQVV